MLRTKNDMQTNQYHAHGIDEQCPLQKKKWLKATSFHIMYTIECLKKNLQQISPNKNGIILYAKVYFLCPYTSLKIVY